MKGEEWNPTPPPTHPPPTVMDTAVQVVCQKTLIDSHSKAAAQLYFSLEFFNNQQFSDGILHVWFYLFLIVFANLDYSGPWGFG